MKVIANLQSVTPFSNGPTITIATCWNGPFGNSTGYIGAVNVFANLSLAWQVTQADKIVWTRSSIRGHQYSSLRHCLVRTSPWCPSCAKWMRRSRRATGTIKWFPLKINGDSTASSCLSPVTCVYTSLLDFCSLGQPDWIVWRNCDSSGQSSDSALKSTRGNAVRNGWISAISEIKSCSVGEVVSVWLNGMRERQSATQFCLPGRYWISYWKHRSLADQRATLISALSMPFVERRVVRAWWSLLNVKRCPHTYVLHFSTAQTHARASFSTAEYFLSDIESVLDAEEICWTMKWALGTNVKLPCL